MERPDPGLVAARTVRLQPLRAFVAQFALASRPVGPPVPWPEVQDAYASLIHLVDPGEPVHLPSWQAVPELAETLVRLYRIVRECTTPLVRNALALLLTEQLDTWQQVPGWAEALHTALEAVMQGTTAATRGHSRAAQLLQWMRAPVAPHMLDVLAPLTRDTTVAVVRDRARVLVSGSLADLPLATARPWAQVAMTTWSRTSAPLEFRHILLGLTRTPGLLETEPDARRICLAHALMDKELAIAILRGLPNDQEAAQRILVHYARAYSVSPVIRAAVAAGVVGMPREVVLDIMQSSDAAIRARGIEYSALVDTATPTDTSTPTGRSLPDGRPHHRNTR